MHQSRETQITGMGLVSGLGLTLAENVSNLKAGKSGIRKITRESTHHQKDFFAASIDESMTTDGKEVENKLWRTLDLAMCEAIESSGLSSKEVSEAGLFLGSTSGLVPHYEEKFNRQFKEHGEAEADIIGRGIGGVSGVLSKKHKIAGPVFTYSTACTSSAVALLAAQKAIRAGRIKRAFVVGVDLLTQLTLYGFRSLLLYDTSTVRPFDVKRNGLQLGEAASVLVLEGEKTSKDGFFLLDGENYNDNSHITATNSKGEVVCQVIKSALERSGVSGSDIVAIKSHGTGTIDNDLSEGRGMKLAFSPLPPFVSLKGFFGHTLGAAGVMETVAYLGCLKAGFVPHSYGFEQMDPQIGASPEVSAQTAKLGNYLFSYFGFGGSCSSYVVRSK